MKAKIIAMLLVVVMVLSLGGCGSSSGTSVPAMEDGNYASDTAGTAQEPHQENTGGGYSAEGLFNLWARESLSDEEIQAMVAAGEISNEAYEEFLIIKSEYLEANASAEEEPEEGSERESTISMDTSSLLVEHVIEFEDTDGYQIRETIQISPIFREDDMETVYALWEALGNDVADFPSAEELYNVSWVFRNMRDRLGCDRLEYIIGTYTIENLTDGFSITPDNPRDCDRRLIPERVLAFDDEHDTEAADIFGSSLVSVVMYPSGAVYYSDPEIVTVGKPKMTSDVWGPCAFVIALPNKSTPNQPGGYRYDAIEITIGNKGYGDSGYGVFELTYYE